jgi:hypothetical protein
LAGIAVLLLIFGLILAGHNNDLQGNNNLESFEPVAKLKFCNNLILLKKGHGNIPLLAVLQIWNRWFHHYN